jgi:hypothetical protein
MSFTDMQHKQTLKLSLQEEDTIISELALMMFILKTLLQKHVISRNLTIFLTSRLGKSHSLKFIYKVENLEITKIHYKYYFTNLKFPVP